MLRIRKSSPAHFMPSICSGFGGDSLHVVSANSKFRGVATSRSIRVRFCLRALSLQYVNCKCASGNAKAAPRANPASGAIAQREGNSSVPPSRRTSLHGRGGNHTHLQPRKAGRANHYRGPTVAPLVPNRNATENNRMHRLARRFTLGYKFRALFSPEIP